MSWHGNLEARASLFSCLPYLIATNGVCPFCHLAVAGHVSIVSA